MSLDPILAIGLQEPFHIVRASGFPVAERHGYLFAPVRI